MSEFFDKLLKKFKRNKIQKPPVWNGADCEKQIVPAFEHGGKQYFTFADIGDLPNERAIYAIRFAQENEMRCELPFLIAHTEAIAAAVNAKDTAKIITLNNDLKDRTDWLFSPSIIMKYASLLYFTEAEKPQRYTEAIAHQKIQQWIADGLTDFFLQLPIKTLFPKQAFSLDSNTDMQTYLSLAMKKEINQFMRLCELLNSTSITTTTNSFLTSRKQELLTMLKQLTPV